MNEYEVPGVFDGLEAQEDAFHPETGELMLGDIVISKEKVLARGKGVRVPAEREYAFLIAHSVLHLIGYDHIEEEERMVMETKQREIMKRTGYITLSMEKSIMAEHKKKKEKTSWFRVRFWQLQG